MRLIKIRIASSTPIWILSPIVLSSNNPESPFIDVDLLLQEHLDIIENSMDLREIFIFDKNNKLLSSIYDVEIEDSLSVNINDENNIVQNTISSVTVPLDDDEEEERINESLYIPSENDFENAKILLNKNGNTVKKLIIALSEDKTTLAFIKACLKVESSFSNRKSIIDVLIEKERKILNAVNKN